MLKGGLKMMGDKILVVDDDQDILDAIQLLLESEGFIVLTANKGEDAFLLSKQQPDLILLDILLSGQDGREIAKFLKNQSGTHAIPILLMSAHPTVSRTIKKTIADGFIAKPFDIDVLVKKVRSHLPVH